MRRIVGDPFKKGVEQGPQVMRDEVDWLAESYEV